MSVIDAEQRLLDMLAGWRSYDGNSPEEEQDRVCDLYQEAGKLWHGGEPIPDDIIKAFVIDKIIPFLLTGK